jgi:hypothetical protein
VKKAEVDGGKRAGLPTEVAEKLKALERENRELAAGQRDPAQGFGVFCEAELDRRFKDMIAFIDDHREVHGVEPICKVLPIAPSTYYDYLAKRADPAKLSARAKRDLRLKPEIERVFVENFEVYGVSKVWRQLHRENIPVARCTVERLMADLGLQGVIRGKPIRTTVQDKAAPCPLDHVNRVFHAPAPNMLWVSDFTYVSTWSGFVYVAFVIDAYARRIVGWRVSRTPMPASCSTPGAGAPRKAARHRGGLVHHSDRGSAIRQHPLHRAPGRGRHRALGRQRRRQLRQRSRRDDQRPLQGRGDPSARTVAELRGRRVRDADLGRLVQQSPAAGAHRQHPAGRSRGTLLRHAGRASHGGVTQTKRPPANPGRFIATRKAFTDPTWSRGRQTRA